MKKGPWIAAAMGLIMPGMGQIHNGEPVKGISVFVIFIMSYVAGLRLATLLPDRLFMAGAACATAIVLAVYFGAIFESYRKACAEEAGYRPGAFGRWYVYVAIWLVESVLVMGGALAYLKGNVIQAYKIVASSMEPQVLRGDMVLVDKTAYRRIPPKIGDIVVFIYPDDRSKVFLRRIAGLPGNKVKGADGHEEYVPHGHVYVLGEGGGSSIDSRTFGFVPLRDLDGKARQIYWSTGPRGVRWDRIGMTL